MVPRTDIAQIRHGSGAVRIVKRQNRSLRGYIRGAELAGAGTSGMLRIALDFRWPAFMAFHQHAERVARHRHCRGVELAPTWDNAARISDIRHDAFRRRRTATGEAGQAERRRREQEELSAIDRIGPAAFRTGELALD